MVPALPDRDGVPLEAIIECDRRLDELSCARLVSSLAEAIHEVQKAGQPVGTVTPAAVLVMPDGSVKLRAAPPSLRYTAPERLRGGAGDRRSDVFALGVILWEALAHERRFDQRTEAMGGGDPAGPTGGAGAKAPRGVDGVDDDAVKRSLLGLEIPPPSEGNAHVPAELDAICKRALAGNPTDRYQSAHVMAAEIDAVLGDAG